MIRNITRTRSKKYTKFILKNEPVQINLWSDQVMLKLFKTNEQQTHTNLNPPTTKLALMNYKKLLKIHPLKHSFETLLLAKKYRKL